MQESGSPIHWQMFLERHDSIFFFFLTLCTSTQSLNESRVQKINPNKKYPDLEKWTIGFGVKFCYGK